MDLGLKGKTVIITGASGGIGRGIAAAFAGEGASVVLGYHRERAAAEELAERLRAGGGRSAALPLDVGDPGSVRAFVSQVAQIDSHIDVLVNNAGILAGFSGDGIESLSLENWETVFRVHMTGTFLCTKEVLPYMKRSGFGRIINISSVHALTGGRAGLSNYAAAKGSVLTFTSSTAREFGRHGITANAIVPGFIGAGMVSGLSSEMREAIEAQNPVNRLGTAEEIGALAAFLASGQAGYISGQAIRCDGGRFDYAL